MNTYGGPEGARKAWDGINERDYAIVSDTDLGLGPALRAHFSLNYFNAKTLETDHEEIHKDRDRARDVVRYEWNGDKLYLTEYPTVTIENRGGYVGARDYRRVEMLADPKAAEWVAAALSLVPPQLRQHVGTFGINFFRTRTTVVSGPHHDGEEFCIVYVVDKVGEGAETRLHHTSEQQTIELRYTLAPGDMLIFRDATYMHDVTPLVSTGSEPRRRDAIVCTVNYHETYPV